MGQSTNEPNHSAVMAWGLSGHHDPGIACGHVLEQAREALSGGPATFAFLFASKHHGTGLEALASRCSAVLETDAIVGMTTLGVVGGRSTIEDRPGVSLLVGSFPLVEARVFASAAHADPAEDADLDDWATGLVQASDSHRGTLLFADPSSIVLSRLLPSIHRAGRQETIAGATASVSRSEKHKEHCEAFLFARGRAQRGGLVGMTLSGAISMQTLVAQGCRPVGPPMVVTASRHNLIQELGGRPAIKAVQEVAHEFSPDERRLVGRGIYLGLAVDEYRERFGRGDFVVHRVLGGHGASGAIAIDESVRPGRTVQVHLLDPGLACGDMGLLMDSQKLYGPPSGALVLSDAVRGRSMFADEWSDATAIARAFDIAPSGADAAKGGYEIVGNAGSIPVGGGLTKGQIAPVGQSCRVHGTCSCVCVFRAPSAEKGDSSDSG